MAGALPGCCLWLDPSDGSFSTTAGFADRTGAVAFSACSVPLQAAAINGRTAMSFAGVGASQTLASSSYATPTAPGTFFAVVAAQTGGAVFGKGGGVQSWNVGDKKFFLNDGTTNETSRGLHPALVGFDANYCLSSVAASGAATMAQVLCWQISAGGAAGLFLNGAACATGTNDYAGNADDGSVLTFGVAGNAANFVGLLGEVAFFDTALSAANVAAVSRYLYGKWNASQGLQLAAATDADGNVAFAGVGVDVGPHVLLQAPLGGAVALLGAQAADEASFAPLAAFSTAGLAIGKPAATCALDVAGPLAADAVLPTTTILHPGCVCAWVSFNGNAGSPCPIFASYNVTSVTSAYSPPAYTVTMPAGTVQNADYVYFVNPQGVPGSSDAPLVNRNDTGASANLSPTTTSFVFWTSYASNRVYVVVIGL